MSDYKRQYRDLEPEVRQKISDATKGKPKSYDHKLHISQAMTKYWSSVPYKDGRRTNKDANTKSDETEV